MRVSSAFLMNCPNAVGPALLSALGTSRFVEGDFRHPVSSHSNSRLGFGPYESGSFARLPAPPRESGARRRCDSLRDFERTIAANKWKGMSTADQAAQ
jgi:hypothetical protein